MEEAVQPAASGPWYALHHTISILLLTCYVLPLPPGVRLWAQPTAGLGGHTDHVSAPAWVDRWQHRQHRGRAVCCGVPAVCRLPWRLGGSGRPARRPAIQPCPSHACCRCCSATGTLGTIAYSAPESFVHNTLKKPSDVYAFGIMREWLARAYEPLSPLWLA